MTINIEQVKQKVEILKLIQSELDVNAFTAFEIYKQFIKPDTDLNCKRKCNACCCCKENKCGIVCTTKFTGVIHSNEQVNGKIDTTELN